MEIAAPTSSQPSIEETLMSFNTASIVSQLDYQYGYNQWKITSVSVTLNSNYPSAGTQPNNGSFDVINSGLFSLSSLSNNSWNPSAVTYNNISNYLPGSGNSNKSESLGTFYYAADGTSTLTWTLAQASAFMSSVAEGSEVTILGTPGDTSVGYLFNTTTKGDPPVLNITVVPTPIPSALLLFGSGLAGLGFKRRRLLA